MNQKTLLDIATESCQLINKEDAETLSLAKSFARNRYAMIYNQELWWQRVSTLAVSVGARTVILPHQYDTVLQATFDYQNRFDFQTQSDLMEMSATVFDEVNEIEGTPTYWTIEYPKYGTLIQPAGTLITVQSNVVSDNTNIVVRGELSGVEQYEELQLNGTTAVSSVNSYDAIYSLSKQATTGTVTVKNNVGTTIGTLFPYERSRSHLRIKLFVAPVQAKTFLILAKKNGNHFNLDGDVPQLAGADSAVLAYTIGDLYQRGRQLGKAQIKYAEGAELVNQMRNLERSQFPRNDKISVKPYYSSVYSQSPATFY